MTTYRPTRGDAKRFLRDLIPGKTYYSITECAQPWGSEHIVQEWVFKETRMFGPKSGHMTATAVLSNYGPIYDTRPQTLSASREQHLPDATKCVPSQRQKAGAR
ncbi:hypothetical protein [Streptomyces sp. NPDC059176]|uniref:hypothetical protein n=1 Tax=Streptomyces sp. NPDC059176 TaxID=3346758 RepID=UPI0036C48273